MQPGSDQPTAAIAHSMGCGVQALGQLSAIVAVQSTATSSHQQAFAVRCARFGSEGAQQGWRVQRMQQTCHSAGEGCAAALQGHIPALHQSATCAGCGLTQWREEATVPGTLASGHLSRYLDRCTVHPSCVFGLATE